MEPCHSQRRRAVAMFSNRRFYAGFTPKICDSPAVASTARLQAEQHRAPRVGGDEDDAAPQRRDNVADRQLQRVRIAPAFEQRGHACCARVMRISPPETSVMLMVASPLCSTH